MKLFARQPKVACPRCKTLHDINPENICPVCGTKYKIPKEVIEKFEALTGKKTICNLPYSGTEVIKDYGEEHLKSGALIVYTSADSVFQIALDTDVIPLETLYEWCEIARRLLDEGNYNVARVIARPYKIIDRKPTRISKDRRDYSMAPPKKTVLDRVKDSGAKVIGIGKIEDIFSKAGITHAIHTGSNKEGLELTIKALKGELPLADMKYPEVNKKSSSQILLILICFLDIEMTLKDMEKRLKKLIHIWMQLFL